MIYCGNNSLDLDFQLLNGQDRLDRHLMERPTVSAVQCKHVLLLNEHSHGFGMELWVLAESSNDGRGSTIPRHIAEIKYHLSDLCWALVK